MTLVEPIPDKVQPRQCGRCRKMFEGDPTLHQTALPTWWLCPPCRVALLGS
ncbi:MAG: hypothetical protein LC733_07930 [Actinobacteria bacterium]|nr:hypothetical protein [Actinomycetota bacterium]